jgi:GGDEF domain-containing protein
MKSNIYRLLLGGEPHFASDALAGSYCSVHEMIQEIDEPAIILLDGLRTEGHGAEAAINAVYQLRLSAKLYAAPIYFSTSMGNLDAFVDGVGINTGEILPQAAEILARMAIIPLERNAAINDLRLLTFLFCRGEGYSLQPLAITASPWLYEYPAPFLIGGFAGETMAIANCLCQFADGSVDNVKLQSSNDWLASLSAQGLLDTAGLVDRIRLCPRCQTANLNYLDFCPYCGSIDFTQKKMIHCFTCGHVAPEENFRQGMMLVCPRCNVALRHIGTDYDRPVESFICNSCGQRFIEPEVKAQCLKCREKAATDELSVRQLYNYTLTAKGKRAVQTGSLNFELSLFDSNRNVLPQYFYQVTDWLLQMKTRYSDEDFSLLCIKIMGIEAGSSAAGITQFQKVTDQFAARIRELVRTTDITTSTGTNIFWVLLPRTNQAGGEILASRVKKLGQAVSLENNVEIVLQVKCFSIPSEYARPGGVAEALLAEYEAVVVNDNE